MSSTNSSNYHLPEVIKVDSEKCVNCHACIGVCPVKYCNNASEPSNGILINSDLCIGCGACIKACTHDARLIVDDTELFFEDLKKGEKIATLVAPASYVNFPDQLENLLSYLKESGVKMNFDVSFGADITSYQYLQAYKNGAKTPIIAQPCPCVVSYIEIYKPNLLKYLSPTGSPVMDTAAWVHQNHPGMKLAFISPCLAKKREFDDPNTHGKVSYNVTLTNLKKYMDANKVNLNSFPKGTFDGPIEAELGLLYSQPGGLFESFKRYNVPLKTHQVRRTEGNEIYEEFFEELEGDLESGKYEVVLIDILNCQHGCNRGTGTLYHERSTDESLKIQSDRLEKHIDNFYNTDEKVKKLNTILENMENIDFSRKYTEKSNFYTELKTPDTETVEIINQEMGKFEEKDIKNCAACGYNSCENMAKACLNGLYRPQQCHHYLEHYYQKHSGDKF